MIGTLFQYVSITQIVLIVVVGVVGFGVIKRMQETHRIARLGAKAPLRKAWAPFGLDTAYNGIQSMMNNRVLQYFNEGFELYGNKNHPHTIELRMGTERVIMTRDDVNIKAILATQFSDYGKGENFNKDWHDFLGNSIFTTDGDVWHNSRQLIRPQFIKDRLGDIAIFEKHASVLINKMAGVPSDRTVDAMDLFFRFALDAATDFLLGRSVDSLLHPTIAFAEAFNDIQRIQSVIARVGDMNWLIPRGHFNKQLKVLNQFVEPYIEDALSLSPEELEKRTKTDEGYTFLHALASHTRDRKVLRDQLVAVLLAGRDTTASTLSWLFYELSLKPEVVRKLRAEILDRVGPTKRPSYEDLKNLKYLQHCLNEILRVYPVIPFNVRLALKDTTLPHGGGPDGLQPVGVLKGTPIGYSTLSMQRRPELYPSEAEGFPPIEEFVPERWDSWTPKAWTYIPFNGGPRICIGQQFALTEMAYVAVRMLQEFKGIENCMTRPPPLKTDIVLMPAEPVLLRFVEAGEKA